MSKIQYDSENQTLFIPEVPGVTYCIDDVPVSGSVYLEEDTIVVASPKDGNRFPEGTETDFLFEVAKPPADNWSSQEDQ